MLPWERQRFDQLMALPVWKLWDVYGIYFRVYSKDPWVQKEKLIRSILQAEKNRWKRSKGQEVQLMPDEKEGLVEEVLDKLLGENKASKKLYESEDYDFWLSVVEGEIPCNKVVAKIADELLTLHAEVLNGGFEQWRSNSSKEQSERTIAALKHIETDSARRVGSIVRAVARWNPEKRDRWGNIQPMDFETEEEFERFDSEYYNGLGDQFEKDVVSWIKQNQ